MKTKITVVILTLLLPVVAGAFYILGSIHSEKKSSKLWKAHFIPMELAAAKAIREGHTSKAITILERNALFYDRSFDIPDLLLPDRWNLDYFFSPEPYDGGSVSTVVSKVRQVAHDYLAANPESISVLPK
ncbi:MAG: hypothetical protein AAGH40_10110 [Verrucomicrobiota bacterium]